MTSFPFLVIVPFVIYLVIIGGLLYLIYTWVNKFINLRQEQNDLLREIINRMDKN